MVCKERTAKKENKKMQYQESEPLTFSYVHSVSLYCPLVSLLKALESEPVYF